MTTEAWALVEDVAKHLGVAKDSVRRWLKARNLPAPKIGRRRKFKHSELDERLRAACVEGQEGGVDEKGFR